MLFLATFFIIQNGRRTKDHRFNASGYGRSLVVFHLTISLNNFCLPHDKLRAKCKWFILSREPQKKSAIQITKMKLMKDTTMRHANVYKCNDLLATFHRWDIVFYLHSMQIDFPAFEHLFSPRKNLVVLPFFPLDFFYSIDMAFLIIL